MPQTLESLDSKILALQKELRERSNRFANAIHTLQEEADQIEKASFEYGRQEGAREASYMNMNVEAKGGKRKTSRNGKKKGTRKRSY